MSPDLQRLIDLQRLAVKLVRPSRATVSLIGPDAARRLVSGDQDGARLGDHPDRRDGPPRSWSRLPRGSTRIFSSFGDVSSSTAAEANNVPSQGIRVSVPAMTAASVA